MDDSVKSIVSGVVGILVGVLLTVFGVSELNKHVVNTAIEIGNTQNESKLRAEDLRDIEEEVKEIQIKAKNSLADLEKHKTLLKKAQSDVLNLIEEIAKTKGPEATQKLAAIQRLVSSLDKSDALERLLAAEDTVASLNSIVNSKVTPDLKWPHAINCGRDWNAIFVLHGSPLGQREPGKELAWYVQVYPSEYRYVRFKSDSTYNDRAGHDLSSVGCEGKTISQLKAEGRAFQFTLSN